MIFIFDPLEEQISVHTYCSDHPNQGEIVKARDDRAKILLALSLSCY
jgi:hypothetical protein